MTTLSNAQLAAQIAELVAHWTQWQIDYRAWVGGTADGGPEGDGRYPVTDGAGTTSLLTAPAVLVDLLEGPAGASAASAAQAAAALTAATAQVTLATTQAGIATTKATAAAADRALTENYKNSAGASEANALVYKNAALVAKDAAELLVTTIELPTAGDITDASATGRSILTGTAAQGRSALGFSSNASSLVTAADYAAMRTLLSLNNVNNTTDSAKPISTATQTALDAKQPLDADLTAIAALATTTYGRSLLTVADVAALKTGLSLSTSDLSNFNTASDARIALQKGAASGIAPLDSGGKISSGYLPALALTDVYSVGSQAAQLALTADEGDVAIRTDLNKSYVHNGGSAGTMADWSELLSPSAGVTSFNTRLGAITLTSADVTTALTYTPTSVTGLTGTQTVAAFKTGLSLVKADVGLGNLDNTSDANKPVSTAQQTALNLKANLASPTFTTPNIGAASGTSLALTGALNLGGVMGARAGPGANSFMFGNSGNGTFTGGTNTGVGHLTLSALTSGSDNAGMGAYCLYSLTTGIRNSALGPEAGRFVTAGSYNVFAGSAAGDTLTSGSNNTIFGFAADVNGGSASYRTVIGSGAVGTVDNSVTLGRAADTVVLPGGRLAFPATAVPSADPYTLDDYREVGFTPTFKFGGGAATGWAFTVYSGTFTKIGRLAVVTFDVAVATKGSATGAVTVSNMPAASANTGGCGTLTVGVSSGPELAYVLSGNDLFLYNSAGTSLTHANLDVNSRFWMSIVYPAS